MTDEEKLNKHYDGSPEKTLITLEQLSQTIEVMTSVVNRLRQHLNEQLEKQNLLRQKELGSNSEDINNASEAQSKRQSLVGIRDVRPERARRRSLLKASIGTWVLVMS